MELKFADEENKPKSPDGLRLSGEKQEGNGLKLAGNESQVENGLKLAGSENQVENGLKLAGNENQVENGLKLTGGENRQKSGLNLTGEESQEPKEDKLEMNPWDVEEPIVVSSIPTTVGDGENTKRHTDGNEMALKISQIIMYVLMVLCIVSIVWLSTQPVVNLYVNLLKFQWLYSLLSLVMLIDLVLVCVLWGRKISLILVAIFFAFWYPKKRNDHVNGYGGIGGILGISYLIASIVLCGIVFKGFSRYGAIIVEEDEATRIEAAAMLDQITENGVAMGDVISDNMIIAEARVEEQKGKTVVVLCGAGNIYIEDDVFMLGTEKNVATQMAFVKNSSTGEYEIAAAALNDTTLSQYGATSYWELLKEN